MPTFIDTSSDDIKIKRDEVLEVSEMLGIKNTYFLDLPTVKLDTLPQKVINDAIAQVVTELQPEVVYIPHRGDVNKDHRLVFEASIVATRPKPGSTINKVLSYETSSETEWAAPLAESIFIPQLYVDITDKVEIKMKALSAYKTELKKYPHPR